MSFIFDFGGMDPQELHERSMETVVAMPTVSAMKPKTERTVTKIGPHIFHISPEGFSKEDPHAIILLRNPVNQDKWRLYSICPRTRGGMTSYRIRGDEAAAIHQAKLIVDLALGIIKIDAHDLTGEDEDEHDEGGHHFGTSEDEQR